MEQLLKGRWNCLPVDQLYLYENKQKEGKDG